ncbi:MAG: bacteriohemerythrin [Nannocystaceae bacterium]|nr:bacteriohemerythrin [Nannocystaceae bacterium]
MAFLDWNGGLHAGVHTMDLEHGQLVRQMNDLHDRCVAGAPRPLVARTLQALYDGTLAHFRHEEAHMRQHRHRGYEAHRRIHRELMQMLTGFRDAFVKDGTSLDREFFDFLEQWLSVHILEVDASYAEDVAA